MQCVPARGSGGSRRLLSNTQIPPVTTLRLNVSPDIAPAEIAAATSAYASLLGHSCAPTNEMTHLLPTNAASDITSGVATPPPSIHDDILTAATSTPGICSLSVTDCVCMRLSTESRWARRPARRGQSGVRARARDTAHLRRGRRPEPAAPRRRRPQHGIYGLRYCFALMDH